MGNPVALEQTAVSLLVEVDTAMTVEVEVAKASRKRVLSTCLGNVKPD